MSALDAAVTLVPRLGGKRLGAKQIIVDCKIEELVPAVTTTQPPMTMTSGAPK